MYFCSKNNNMVAKASIRIWLSTFFIICSLACANAQKKQPATPPYERYVGVPVKALYEKAQQKERQGEYDSALTFYSIIYNHYSENALPKDMSLYGLSLLHSGDICYGNFNYVEALNYYFRCQDFCEKNGLKDLLAQTLKSIGNVYSQHGDYAGSDSLYRQCYRLACALDDKRLQNRVLYDLVVANALLGKLDKARAYRQKLGQCSDRHGDLDDYQLAFTSALIAEVCGNMTLAKRSYQAAISLCHSKRYELRWLGSARSSLARVMRKEGDTTGAMALLRKNEQDADRHHQKDLLTSTYHEIADLYLATGDNSNYVKYQMKFISLNNDTYNASSLTGLRNAQFLHELNRSKDKLKKMALENEQWQHNVRQMWTLTIGGTVFIIILAWLLALLWRQKRRLQSAYQDLYERNDESLRTARDHHRQLEEADAKVRHLEKLLATQTATYAKENTTTTKPTTTGTHTPKSPDDENRDLYSRIMHVMENTDAYLDADFTIERLAALVGSTSHALSREINEKTGQNFRTLLAKYRIREAMERLGDVEAYGNYTVRAIAESVGYKSQSNFIAVFTKTTGMKPSLYQRIAIEKSKKHA